MACAWRVKRSKLGGCCVAAWLATSAFAAPVQAPADAASAVDARAASLTASDHDCMIEARQTLEIRSSVEALIEQVLVDRGDRVRRGQAIVRLESATESAAVEAARLRAQATGALEAARARVASTSRRLARADELVGQQFIASSARDDAATEHEVAVAQLREAEDAQRIARADLKRAEAALAMRTLRSPIAGVVVDRQAGAGELAVLTGRPPLVTLAETDPLRVRVVLPASTFGQLRLRMRAEVMPEGSPATAPGGLQAVVERVDPVVHGASGTYTALLTLPNQAQRVTAGVRCRLRFLTR